MSILAELARQAGLSFLGDEFMKRTGLGDRASGILDDAGQYLSDIGNAIIPPAAASDASAIPQDLIPADVVMTPAQEQQVMQNADRYSGYPYREGGDAVGANVLPIDSARQAQVTQMTPTRLPDMTMQQGPEERRDEVQDFVRMVGGRTQNLMQDVPEEARQNPEVQQGAAALATTEALVSKGMEMPDEPMDLGAPVVGPKDVAQGMYPDGKSQQEQSEPDFFDKAGSFLTDLFGDEERMTRMALAFNSMRLQPDQGLATVLGKRLETLSAQRDRQKMAMSGNQTMKLLDKYPDLKAAYLSGQMTLKDVLTNINAMRRLEIDEGKPAAFRALEARAQAAGLKPGTDAYNQFMINGGQRKGMSLRVNKDGSIEMVEGGDLSSLTETQSNALVFSQRMKEANSILDKVEMQGADFLQTMMQKVPVAGNYLISEEQQSYQQAKENFINATLRKESGAAIADSEFTRADKQYFPTPGDSPQVIAQKRANRELAQKLIESGVPNVNKIVEKSGADVGAGAETLESTPTTKKPPITPEQARAELARRRGQ
jgi:hypothetical protein